MCDSTLQNTQDLLNLSKLLNDGGEESSNDDDTVSMFLL